MRQIPIKYNAAESLKPDLLEPKNGEHVWMAIVGFVNSAENMRKAHGGKETVHLDMENIAIMTVGCFICEEPYSERLSYRKCAGEPAEVEG